MKGKKPGNEVVYYTILEELVEEDTPIFAEFVISGFAEFC